MQEFFVFCQIHITTSEKIEHNDLMLSRFSSKCGSKSIDLDKKRKKKRPERFFLYPSDLMYLSASMAALAPEPAATTACR